jgi:hypothetical protein
VGSETTDPVVTFYLFIFMRLGLVSAKQVLLLIEPHLSPFYSDFFFFFGEEVL